MGFPAEKFHVETIEPNELESTHAPEWHEARRTGIGGSDIVRILSGSAEDVFYEKTRPYVDTGETLSVDQYRGHTMEPLMREAFRRQTGRIVRRHGIRRHRGQPWAIVNADGQVLATETEETGGLEIKAPRRETYARILEGGYRVATLLQMQWGIHVTGYDHWYYMAGNLESSPPFVLFKVHREPDLLANAAEVVEEFWTENVEPRILPDNEHFNLLGAEILGIARELNVDKQILSDADFELAALGYAEARRNKKDATELQLEYRNELIDHLGALRTPEIISGRWKVGSAAVQDKETFDLLTLRHHRPIDRDAFVRWARQWALAFNTPTTEELAVELELDLDSFVTRNPQAPRINVRDLEGDL